MHSHTFIAAAGGTGGSIGPLLALLEGFPGAKVVWVGTRSHWDKERDMVAKSSVYDARHWTFASVSSGKLRRYWDVRNVVDPFRILFGFFESLRLLWRARPCAVLTAGSYVAVPVAWAALVLRVPVVLYVQDVCLGLANRLMAKTASLILCVRQDDVKKFAPKLQATSYKLQARTVGALVRSAIVDGSRERALKKFHLEEGIPTLLVIGGGTGSAFLNTLVQESLSTLVKAMNVIHVYSQKTYTHVMKSVNMKKRYHPVQFLIGEDLADAYAVADVVVTRAGMGVLTELAANKKTAIVVPLPDSHQEANADLLVRYRAALVVDQRSLSEFRFLDYVNELLFQNPQGGEMRAEHLHALFPRANPKDIADLVLNHSCGKG